MINTRVYKGVRASFSIIAVLLIGSGALTTRAVLAQNETVLDEIVAVVGSQIVLQSDVDGLVVNMLQQQETPYSDELWAGALEQLINQKVMSVVAKRDTTIEVTDDQVEQALEQRVDQITQQVGSESALEELYGKSIIQIKTEMREEFRDQLLAEQLQQRKLNQIRITPSEVSEWFAQFPTDSLPTIPEIVRISHVVRYPALTDAVKQEAMEIVTAIRDSVVTGGGDFEELARTFSEDPGSAPSGGHMEEMSLGDLVPEFAAVASREPIGQVSQPFLSPFGYHIVRVNDRRGDIVDFNHILIAINDLSLDPTETIAYLNALRDSIDTFGIPFEVLAKRNSEEEQSANLGGRVTDPRSFELDLFSETLGIDWRTLIDTLEVDEVSYPAEVELLNGRRAYHIVKLNRRVAPHQWNIRTDYARIEQFALQEKRAIELEDWIDKLRKSVYVDYRGKAKEMHLAELQ